MRKIFDTEPDSWQDLENKVQQAFCEMGYESHRDHQLETIRGRVRVDVYATKKSTPIPTIIVCECKHWEKAVKQSVVYAARSVCCDVGAHFGLIISKKGFQSGATETRASTNIHLLDFEQFQDTFFDEWRTGVFMSLAQLGNSLQPLIAYPLQPKRDSFAARLKGVDVLRKYAMFFSTQNYTAFFIGNGSFPLSTYDPRGDPSTLEPIIINSYREFIEVATEGVGDARKYFEV
jgi:hypothetical protein